MGKREEVVICPVQRYRNFGSALPRFYRSATRWVVADRRSWGERTLPSRMAGAVGLGGEDAEQTGRVMAGVCVVRSGRAVLLAGGGTMTTADGHGGRTGGYRAERNVVMGRTDGRGTADKL